MLSRHLILSAVLSLSSLGGAQQGAQQPGRTTSPGSDTACAATFASGKGHNATQYCVTKNGNIAQFSRGDQEFIQVGNIVEGYAMCDFTASPAVGYFDYASSDSGNLEPSTFSSKASNAISTRITRDGIWEITNTISKVAANAMSPGAAKVSMKIRNLTPVDRVVFVTRVADIDFAQGGTLDFNNDFDFTANTAFGLEPVLASGLSLTNNTFPVLPATYTLNTPVAPDPCNPGANRASQPFVGDGSIAATYELLVPKQGAKTIVLTYKPI